MQIGGSVTAGRDAILNEGGNQTITQTAENAELQREINRLTLAIQSQINSPQPDVPTLRGLLRDAVRIAPDIAKKMYVLWHDPLSALGIFEN